MANTFDFGSGMPLPPPPNSGNHTQIRQLGYQQQPQPWCSDVGYPAQHGSHGPGMPTDPTHSHHQLDPYARYTDNGGYNNVQNRQRLYNPNTDHGVSGGARVNRMPSFSNRADPELLRYLQQRMISPSFLWEIDQFLNSNPILRDTHPDWIRNLEIFSPLRAYKMFMTGYTRPARYVRNALPDIYSLVVPAQITPLAEAYDVELVEFFAGFEYRFDTLRALDQEVQRLRSMMMFGQRILPRQLKLLAYACYANPVDAYKYYEYNYQKEYLPHYYLPEHVVLKGIPKPENYTIPRPYSLAHAGERRGARRTYPFVRRAMARANDAGCDVIEVLMEEYSRHLMRRGCSRQRIDQLCKQATSAINRERDDGGSADIVDLVMSMGYWVQPLRSAARNGGARNSSGGFNVVIINNDDSINRNGQGQPRKSVKASQRIIDYKRALEKVMAQQRFSGPSGATTNSRRVLERALVIEVTSWALNNQTMTRGEYSNIRMLVPVEVGKRKEERLGQVDVLQLLSRWI